MVRPGVHIPPCCLFGRIRPSVGSGGGPNGFQVGFHIRSLDGLQQTEEMVAVFGGVGRYFEGRSWRTEVVENESPVFICVGISYSTSHLG